MMKKISIFKKTTKQENEPFTFNPFQEGYKFLYPNLLLILALCKGQLISEYISLWYLLFSQKPNKKIRPTTMVPQVNLFQFIFWEN